MQLAVFLREATREYILAPTDPTRTASDEDGSLEVVDPTSSSEQGHLTAMSMKASNALYDFGGLLSFVSSLRIQIGEKPRLRWGAIKPQKRQAT